MPVSEMLSSDPLLTSPRVPWPTPDKKNLSPGDASAWCGELTAAHYENFPVGSVLLPRSLRPAVHSIYAFARIADDFSDEDRRIGTDEAERVALLEAWERELDRSLAGEARHPVFVALSKTIQDYRLPPQLFRDLLSAFKQDVLKRRYTDFNEVLDYCSRSANPVGRLILTLFGYRSEELHRLSDHLCTGLQLANFWQDVAVDLQKDRVYLPQDDLRRFAVADGAFDPQSAAFQQLMAFQVERTRQIFRDGAPLPEQVRGRLRYELRLTWNGGMRILEKLEGSRYDMFHHRPTLGRSDAPVLLWRSLHPFIG